MLYFIILLFYYILLLIYIFFIYFNFFNGLDILFVILKSFELMYTNFILMRIF